MIAHHGGETALLPALVIAAGSLPVAILLVRNGLTRLGTWLRRGRMSP